MMRSGAKSKKQNRFRKISPLTKDQSSRPKAARLVKICGGPTRRLNVRRGQSRPPRAITGSHRPGHGGPIRARCQPSGRSRVAARQSRDRVMRFHHGAPGLD